MGSNIKDKISVFPISLIMKQKNNMQQFTETELKNLLIFLTTGNWTMKAQDSQELLSLIKKIQDLTTVKVEDNTETTNNG